MLTLAGASNYAGGTTVQNGLLQLSNANALGAPSGALAANGGTLDLGGNSVTVGSFSGASGVVTNNGGSNATLTVNQTGVTAFNGNITDGATRTTALALTGPGELALNGVNTYSGTTTVANSQPDSAYHDTLDLNGLLNNSPVSIQSGVLVLGGTIGQSVTMSGGGIDDAGSPYTPTIAGNVTVTGGTVNWYTALTTVGGSVTVQGGRFNVGTGAALEYAHGEH